MFISIFRILLIGFLLATLGISIHGALTLDQQIPMHFNEEGIADRWGSPQWLWGMAVFPLILMSVLQWMKKHPEMWNIMKMKSQHEIIMFKPWGVLLITGLQAMLCAIFFGISVAMTRSAQWVFSFWLPACIILMGVGVIIYLFAYRSWKNRQSGV